MFSLVCFLGGLPFKTCGSSSLKVASSIGVRICEGLLPCSFRFLFPKPLLSEIEEKLDASHTSVSCFLGGILEEIAVLEEKEEMIKKRILLCTRDQIHSIKDEKEALKRELQRHQDYIENNINRVLFALGSNFRLDIEGTEKTDHSNNYYGFRKKIFDITSRILSGYRYPKSFDIIFLRLFARKYAEEILRDRLRSCLVYPKRLKGFLEEGKRVNARTQLGFSADFQAYEAGTTADLIKFFIGESNFKDLLEELESDGGYSTWGEKAAKMNISNLLGSIDKSDLKQCNSILLRIGSKFRFNYDLKFKEGEV